MIKGIEVHKKSYSLKWDIENRCNLKCKHCMLSEVTYKPECTLNENKIFLKRLIDLGINQVLFMSKEPLLYNSIEELVTQTSHIPKRVKTFNFLTLNAKIFIP